MTASNPIAKMIAPGVDPLEALQAECEQLKLQCALDIAKVSKIAIDAAVEAGYRRGFEAGARFFVPDTLIGRLKRAVGVK